MVRRKNQAWTTVTLNEPVEKGLLAAVSADEYARPGPHLQPIEFSLGEVVYEFGGELDYVFFPTTSIVSLLYTMGNGTSAEVGLTGSDGVVGIALFMGGGTMPNRAFVQSAGCALRMKARILQDEFALGGTFQHLLFRYTQALITQISQTAVCNRLHSLEQQLCRWLLLSHDRVKTGELVMTQELIADMLGAPVRAFRSPQQLLPRALDCFRQPRASPWRSIAATTDFPASPAS